MTEIKIKTYSDLIKHLYQDHSNDFLIIDEMIFTLYPDFQKWDQSRLVVLPNPESKKNYEGFGSLTDNLLKKGISRQSRILAVGGGALSDLAGFVSATINRGVEWSVIPTSLLSQIDAALGGKVAINAEQGKNLIGAFHPPHTVYLCHEFLSTLPKEEFTSGLGELVKYAFLSSSLLEDIIRRGPTLETIEACLRFKEKVTTEDPEEKLGVRKKLNLGHTLGHAYEYYFKLPHGLAVLLGLKKIGEAYFPKLIKNYYPLLIKALKLEEVDHYLSTLKVSDIEKFWGFVSKDKKGDGLNIDLVMLDDIEKVVIKSTSIEELKRNIIL